MKVYAISDNKQFLRIGDREDTKNWFKISDKISGFMDKIQILDNVEIKFKTEEDGTKILTFIKTVSEPTSVLEGTLKMPFEYMKPKTPEESAGIKRQSIGNMVSRTISGIDGVTLDNVEETIKKLYKIYEGLVV